MPPMSTGTITRISDGYQPNWYLGATNSNFTLQGRESANITVTLVHNQAPRTWNISGGINRI